MTAKGSHKRALIELYQYIHGRAVKFPFEKFEQAGAELCQAQLKLYLIGV